MAMLNYNPTAELPVDALRLINKALELLGDEVEYTLRLDPEPHDNVLCFDSLDHLPIGLKSRIRLAEESLNEALISNGHLIGLRPVAANTGLLELYIRS